MWCALPLLLELGCTSQQITNWSVNLSTTSARTSLSSRSCFAVFCLVVLFAHEQLRLPVFRHRHCQQPAHLRLQAEWTQATCRVVECEYVPPHIRPPNRSPPPRPQASTKSVLGPLAEACCRNHGLHGLDREWRVPKSRSGGAAPVLTRRNSGRHGSRLPLQAPPAEQVLMKRSCCILDSHHARTVRLVSGRDERRRAKGSRAAATRVLP